MEAFGQQRALVDAADAEVWIRLVPDQRWELADAGPGFERVAVGGAVSDEPTRARETGTVRPHRGQATVRLLDEVVEVALPAPVEVREEQQVPAAVDHRPMREVDRRQLPEATLRVDESGEQVDRREHDAQQRPPKRAALDGNDARQMVLHTAAVFERLDSLELLTVRSGRGHGVDTFSVSQHCRASADQDDEGDCRRHHHCGGEQPADPDAQ